MATYEIDGNIFSGLEEEPAIRQAPASSMPEQLSEQELINLFRRVLKRRGRVLSYGDRRSRERREKNIKPLGPEERKTDRREKSLKNNRIRMAPMGMHQIMVIDIEKTDLAGGEYFPGDEIYVLNSPLPLPRNLFPSAQNGDSEKTSSDSPPDADLSYVVQITGKPPRKG